MKNYIATFWRGNPQHKNGGYFTIRTFRAKSLENATKQAEKYTRGLLYGTMRLDNIKEESK